MKPYERVKIFSGADTDVVEEQYNAWVREMTDFMAGTATLNGINLEIVSRDFVIRQYEGEETFALCVYYVHWDLEPRERGNQDYGAGVAGVSTTGSGVRIQKSRK